MDTPITSTKTTSGSTIVSWVKIIKNMYGTCFIYNFSREIDWNGLRYVRGLQGMLINVDNVNHAESYKWVYDIFKKHMTHALYPIFQEKSIGDGLKYVRGFKSCSSTSTASTRPESHKCHTCFWRFWRTRCRASTGCLRRRRWGCPWLQIEFKPILACTILHQEQALKIS